MKKVTLALAMAALVIFAGCKKDKEITGTTLKASIEQYKSGDSKTSIVPVGSEAEIRWTAGDKIVVNNGTTSGTFTLTGGAGSKTGTFTYNGEYTLGDNNIAVYPETATINGTTVTVTLPAEQDFDANKNGANPMLGIFTDPEELTFTSLCGVLGISLTGDNIAITAVEVVSKTDEKLNGEFSCTTTNPQLTVAAGDADTKKVRINYNTTLTSTAQNFYFALPVGALASGFTLNVYGVGADPIFSKATTNAITIALNVVNQMPEVEVTAASNIIDLSTLSESYTAQDGDIITGTANGSFSLRIPGDVSVTLRNVDCTEEFTIRCMDFEPGEHSVSINLEGNNSAWNFAQVVGIKNLTISGDGRLDLGNNMSFGPGCNTTIEGTTITGSLIYIGNEYSGEENTLTIDGGSVSINGGILAYNDTNINVENDGNLILHVTKDDWFSTVFPGIEGSSGSEVNVTITDGVNGNSNLTIISYENSFTGDKFIKAQSINFGGTDVKEAWDAKTWSADGYQNFGPLRATYTASSRTLVLATNPDPAPVITLETPLTLEALSDGTIVVYDPQWGMQYTLNGGAKQTMSGSVSIDVNTGDKVAFYGNGTSITSYLDTKITGGTADVKVYGNIMSLVDEENFATATTLSETYTFYRLFNHYEHLTDASGLLLPATTLASANYCYAEMFSNSDNLVAGPSELPATTLSLRCYQAMFSYCPSLTVAPILPATTLEGYCYFQMFRFCTSLTEAPVLPAPELTGNCYREMFSGCSSLNSITCLATSVINSSNSTMMWMNGVASSGTFTKANGANVSTDAGGSGSTWPRSNRGIPEGWTVK